jgi:L-ornithine N5-oxygenase
MKTEKTSNNDIFDVVGIGFGPSNLSLAAAIDECDKSHPVRALFLEQKPAFAWHPNMLLSDTVMQISFLKDLVTQRNPGSEFTFINFLKSQGRLGDFINLKTFYPSRIEFNSYMAWVAEKLKKYARFGSTVTSITAEGALPHQLAKVNYRDHATGEMKQVFARNIIVAVGGKPNVPFSIEVKDEAEHIWHSSQYLQKIADKAERIGAGHRFVVIGRGQSAAEIVNDLHGRYKDASVTCMFRGYGLKPSDSSEFVNGMFDSSFVDDINAAPPELRQKIMAGHLDTNYSVVDAPLISRLYELQYQERITGQARLKFRNFSNVSRIVDAGRGVEIVSEDGRTGAIDSLEADTVVLATGYVYSNPPKVLAEIAEHFQFADSLQPKVNRNYRVAMKDSARFRVYLQGCNESTHGLGDTLLSNLSIRADEILGDILGGLGGETGARLGHEELFSSIPA